MNIENQKHRYIAGLFHLSGNYRTEWHEPRAIDFTIFIPTCLKNSVPSGTLDKVKKVYYN